MTWTYTGPADSAKDEVRFLLGDTVEADPLLSDEEIAYLLSGSGDDVYGAAIAGARQVATQFARLATSKSVGDMSLSYSDRARAFEDVASRLERQRSASGLMRPWVHPNSLVRAVDKDDPGSNGTEFRTGIHDNAGS